MAVSEARGVLLLTSEIARLPIFEYTPLQVKSALVGYGRAEKQQVEYMVKKILQVSLPRVKTRGVDDAYDALALALTHLYSI